MANAALRPSWLRATVIRATSLLVVGGLLLTWAMMAEAQNTTPSKPKVAVTKPEDKKPEDSQTSKPKVAVTKPEDPKTTTPTKPADPPVVSVGSAPGFAAIEEGTRIINEHLAKAWKENQLQPSPRCDDYEFCRRAFLDIIGRIPTVEEIDHYMRDPQATRRGQLLDRLLTGELKDAYANNFATLWTNWLMTRTGPRLYREQIHLWLYEAFSTEIDTPEGKKSKPHISHKEMVEQLITATGKSNDNGAVNYILAHLGGPVPAAQQAREGAFDVVPITSRTVRLFLGYQIQCTQCHDHPFNADWKQKHFWGVNVFFRQVERVGQVPMNNNQRMQDTILTLRDNPNYNTKGIVFYEKRNGVFLPSEPMFLDGRKIPQGAQSTRREELARFIVSHKNFSPAYVNRIWAHLFGRGLNVKPAADDFGEHNEVVHPELLAKLSEQFERSGGYDPRKLIKWICSSDAYNLKAVANPTNIAPEAEPYFARMSLKMMSPEQLLESLITATKPAGVDDTVTNAQRSLRNQWMQVLTRNFGDDEGNEGVYTGTILQALLMMNGRDLNQAISTTGSGTVQKAMQRTDPKQVVDYLFKATLSRPANAREYQQILQAISKVPLNDRQQAGPLQDLFWALLNCNEFILNH